MSKHVIVTPLKTYINPRLEHDPQTREWRIAYTYRDPGASRGLSGRVRLGNLTRAEAEVAFAAWQAQITAQTAPASPVKILDQILTPYETALRGRERKALTNLGEIHRLRQALGHLPIETLNNATMEEYRRQRGVKPQSLRRTVGVLNAAFHDAFKEGVIVLTERRVFRLPEAGPRREWFLDEEQAPIFRARAMEDSDGRPLTTISKLVALGLDTGARCTAMQELEYDRIDLKLGLINFKVPGVKYPRNKRRVAIPIRKSLRPVLERAFDERGPDDRYFLGPNVERRFRAWVNAQSDWKGAHYEKAHIHGFRHTFISLLMRNRPDLTLSDIGALVGDTARMIEDVYGHFRKAAQIKDF